MNSSTTTTAIHVKTCSCRSLRPPKIRCRLRVRGKRLSATSGRGSRGVPWGRLRILPRVIEQERSDLPAGVIRSLLWLAAFCFAAGIFLTATLLLRGVPPTPHVAVGRVTVENASKLRDYLTALLFLLITPAATIPLFRLGVREYDRL